MAASTSYIIDVSEWLLGGAGVLDSDLKLSDSRLTGARAFPSNLEVQLQAHVGEANGDDDEEEEKGDAAPPPAAQLQISLAELPPRDPAVVARAADDRVGFWNLHFTELGSTTAADAPLSSRKADREVRVVHRWHLTKPSGTTATAVPLKPITFHVDVSVPPRWRAAVARGVTAWNAAFERAGYASAVRAPPRTTRTGLRTMRRATFATRASRGRCRPTRRMRSHLTPSTLVAARSSTPT